MPTPSSYSYPHDFDHDISNVTRFKCGVGHQGRGIMSGTHETQGPYRASSLCLDPGL